MSNKEEYEKLQRNLMPLEEAIMITHRARTYEGWMAMGLMRYELVPWAHKIVAEHYVLTNQYQ